MPAGMQHAADIFGHAAPEAFAAGAPLKQRARPMGATVCISFSGRYHRRTMPTSPLPQPKPRRKAPIFPQLVMLAASLSLRQHGADRPRPLLP